MSGQDRLIAVHLDETGLAPPTPEVEQERNVAIYDLLESNSFALPDGDKDTPAPGPYELTLSIRDRRLVLGIVTEDGSPARQVQLSLTPLRQVVKDYFSICESYFDAVRHLPPARIEAIDVGRRSIHNEGSRILRERLEGQIATDTETARRLFTLICVLHFTG